MAPAVKTVGFFLMISFSLSNADFAQLFKELYQKAQQSNTPVVVLLDKTGQSSNSYQTKQQMNRYRDHDFSSLGRLKYNSKHSLVNLRTNDENRYPSKNLIKLKDRQRNRYDNYDRYQRSAERYRNYETDEWYDHRDRYERHERYNRHDRYNRNDKLSGGVDDRYHRPSILLDSSNQNNAYRLHSYKYFDSYEKNDRYNNPNDRYPKGSAHEQRNDRYSPINRYFKDISRTGKDQVKNILRISGVEYCDKNECDFTDEKNDMTTEGIISLEEPN